MQQKWKKKVISFKIEENKSYRKQKTCYICKKEFSSDDKKYCKVKDHCHSTRKYRGAAHNVRNLR